MSSTTEIEALLASDVSEDELFARLADSAALGADEIRKEEEGKAFFARLWAQQSELVCSNAVVQAYIRDPNASDSTAIAAQLLNLLIVVPGVNMVLVACLIVRIGLRKLCQMSEE